MKDDSFKNRHAPAYARFWYLNLIRFQFPLTDLHKGVIRRGSWGGFLKFALTAEKLPFLGKRCDFFTFTIVISGKN